MELHVKYDINLSLENHKKLILTCMTINRLIPVHNLTIYNYLATMAAS